MQKEISVQVLPAKTIYGLWSAASDKTVAKDIPQLSKKYNKAISKPVNSEPVIPFYVLSKDYDEQSRRFKLFIGAEHESKSLSAFVLPEGLYCIMRIRPKIGFLWGPAIGQAKIYFYTQWLPHSEYVALHMEYEHHTQKSLGKKPEIDLYFAVREKGNF